MDMPFEIDLELKEAVDHILLAAARLEYLPLMTSDGEIVAGYINTADRLRDIADSLMPPGKTPVEEGGAQVFYIEQERSKRRLGH
jgi:hypothetical protein